VANEVCFSPDSPCEVKLLKFLRSAKTSVELAIFDLNLESVVSELRILAERVPVRVIADRRMSKSDHSRIPELKGSKVGVRFGKQKGIMHHKFVVIDGKRLELGSFNFTNGAANKNQENQLYLDTATVVAAYRSRFEKMWSEASY
jgi:phosphatidylserine/phosphatidylglycerophosphate/cardiolipin synthase-like enzyme